MCQKLPYLNPRIDLCMREEIKEINKRGLLRTIGSCCGHNRYPKSLIVQCKSTGYIFEYYSMTFLSKSKRKSRKYYKKDVDGYYFIPELKNENLTAK